MKETKKCLSFIILLLIISATLTISIKADEKKASLYNDSDETSLETSKFEVESIHHFCFVKNGDYIEIRNVRIIRGFWFAYYTPFCFCIGDVELYSKGELIVKNLFGKTIYENVHVSMTGFVGGVCQTGAITCGFLKGFARTIEVTPPYNQEFKGKRFEHLELKS